MGENPISTNCEFKSSEGVPDLGQRNVRNIAIWGRFGPYNKGLNSESISVSLRQISAESLFILHSIFIQGNGVDMRLSVLFLIVDYYRLNCEYLPPVHKSSILSSCVGQRQDLDNCWSPALDLWPKMWRFEYLVYLA